MRKYVMVVFLVVLAVIIVSGCATPTSGVRYHYGESLPLAPMPVAISSVPVVVEIPPQPREVWLQTSQGSVQAWQQGRETYVVDGAGQIIPVSSGIGLDIVYSNPQDIRVMRHEDRSDFYALLRADQQGHRQSMDWARYRLQRDQQEHWQELDDRRQDLREQEQAVQVLEDLNRMRNQNVLSGTNVIPTSTQIQERRREVKTPIVVRTSEQRSVRVTVPSVSKPVVTERRVNVERKSPVVVPPKKRTSRPEVSIVRERVTPVSPTSVRAQRVVVRPEVGSQPRTRGER